MTTQVSPVAVSFSGTPDIDDATTPLSDRSYLQNSMYDKSGQLLFTVNRNGIYNPDGSNAYDFNAATYTTTITIDGTDHVFTPLYAVSEIVIFPVVKSSSNRSYYVVFWAKDQASATIGYSYYDLRCIKVDVANYTGALTFTDHILYDESTDAAAPGLTKFLYGGVFHFAVAAEDADCGESRNLYTLEPTVNSGYHANGWAGTQYVSNYRKWTFGADGSLPSSSVNSFVEEYPIAYSSKAKIFSRSGEKYLNYVSGLDEPGAFYPVIANNLVQCKIADATVSVYTMSGFHYIKGFEYVPSQDKLYVSYVHLNAGIYDPTTSGLGYFDLITLTGTAIPSTGDYSNTDLELTKAGDLLLVKGEASNTSDEGHLAYLPVGSPGYVPSTDVPIEISSTCSSYVSCASFLENTIGGTQAAQSYYLGSQIKGENYGTTSVPDIVINSSQTWTPTSNPFVTSSGVSPLASVNVHNLKIKPGASLTIQNMTVKFASDAYLDVEAGTSTAAGGRLYLDNATLTANTGGCDNPSWSMWRGVRLHGKIDVPQLAPGTTKQACLYMSNNSEISYADTAVHVGVKPTGSLVFVPFFIAYTAFAFDGGGQVNATNSTFRNNHNGVVYWPYGNFNPVTHAPINNVGFFSRCKFTSDDAATLSDGMLRHFAGAGVKGVWIAGCEFENNNTSPSILSYGIWSNNMGFRVTSAMMTMSLPEAPCKFSNFSTAIDHYSSSGSTGVVIGGSEFRNNRTGINLKNTSAPVVAGNSFWVPYVSAALPSPFLPPYTTSGIPTYGLAMYGCSKYSVYSNKFQINTSSGLAPYFSAPDRAAAVTGILVWNNMDGTDHIINNNTFKGLGVANLANYKNRQGTTGLWYRCNTQSDNRYDIATLGGTPPYSVDDNSRDGIRERQGYQVGYSSAYPSGLPAANTFSYGKSAYNLYDIGSECYTIDYYYVTSSGGTPQHEPGVTGVTGVDYELPSITKYLLSFNNGCPIPGTTIDAKGSTIFVEAGGRGVIDVNSNMGPDQVSLAVNNNISYYMCDDSGVDHRDSLYYWLAVKNTPASHMSIAYMLLEDTLIDSAFVAYDAIVTEDSLTDRDSLAYGYWGKRVFMVQLSQYLKAGVSTVTFADLAADLDTLSDSTVASRQVTELTDIVRNATGWPRIQAENLLLGYDAGTYETEMLAIPDTVLYPDPPDTTAADPAPKGVLALTEFSGGAETGCQYVEIMVANCGSDASAYVDVRGWIVNDNSGIFNGSCEQGVGISQGYLRLSYDDVWKNVPVGSFLVLYNEDGNCYDLPDTFTVDTFASTYYVPVGIAGNHLQQFTGAENNSACTYCSDTGITVFDTTSGWITVIGLDEPSDGIQVLCPGCSAEAQGTPAFYHGVGYGNVQASDGGLLQTPVLTTGSAAGKKFVFVGTSSTDLVAATQWEQVTADAAGVQPESLGIVESEFYQKVISHDLNLPCCSVQQGQQGKSSGETTSNAEMLDRIKVYPNPSDHTINFEFGKAQDVTVRIADLLGRTVVQKTVSNTNHARLNMSNCRAGVYFFTLSRDGKTSSGKIVVAH